MDQRFQGALEFSANSVSAVKALQPKTPRNTPVLEQVGLTARCNKRQLTLWGTVGCLSKRVLERISSRIWAGVR